MTAHSSATPWTEETTLGRCLSYGSTPPLSSTTVCAARQPRAATTVLPPARPGGNYRPNPNAINIVPLGVTMTAHSSATPWTEEAAEPKPASALIAWHTAMYALFARGKNLSIKSENGNLLLITCEMVIYYK